MEQEFNGQVNKYTENVSSRSRAVIIDPNKRNKGLGPVHCDWCMQEHDILG